MRAEPDAGFLFLSAAQAYGADAMALCRKFLLFV
jgi:hypothetical protein